MSIKITPMPTLRSLSTEIQLLAQTSTHISSDLGTLLRTTQQIIAAHNDLKARIKTVSEGLEGVARVEEGIVSVDKGILEAERDGDAMVFVKTPPTTPPTHVNSSVDPGQKIWRPNLQNGNEKESTKNGSKRERNSARSSKQSSHASSPSHPIAQIDSVLADGFEKESPPSQRNTPYLPGAYVFSEVSSPVKEPFLGLGSGRDEELDINAVLAQLAEKEREHAMEEETETERKRSSRQNSRTSSKKSTPSYRRSPNMPMEKIPEHQQGIQEAGVEVQGQNQIWKGFNAAAAASSSPLWSTSNIIPRTYFLSDDAAAEVNVNGNKKIHEGYAINLIPNADEFIEYVDSPRDSPPTMNGNVNNSKRNSQIDIKPLSKASVSASAAPASVPEVKNGKVTNGGYSFAYPNTNNNNGNGNGHVANGNGKTVNGNGNVHDFATIRAKSTNNNNPTLPRPNPFSFNSTSTAAAAPTTVHAPAPIPSVTRSTQVPLRSKSPPASISKATATNGNGNGHLSSYQQTNAAVGATIARPLSAMSNASASSSVMSPPYEVFHPPRQTDSDSDSDSDSQDSDREFFEKMLERASDTEGMKPKEKVDKGKGREINVPTVDKGKGKEKEKERAVVETVYPTEEPSTPRPGGESSSKYRESTTTLASNGHSSKPPSVRSKTSPKVSGENIVTDTTTGELQQPQAVYPTIRTSPATSTASTTQDNTPMPYPNQLHPHSHPHSVSTFSHDMMRSPQVAGGQRAPEPSETPRAGNGFGGPGRSSANASNASLSLGAVGEALQQSQNQSNGHGHATRTNGHSQLPPSAFVSSSLASSRASAVTFSSTSSGDASVPESSNASPDISPSIRDNISVWASGVNGQATAAAEGGQNGNGDHQQQQQQQQSSTAATQSQSWKTFDRATITRHPTNSSYHSNGNDGDGIFCPPASIASTTASASDAYPTITQERGRAHHFVTASVPPSPSSSVTRHSSLRRERERERDKESQRPTLRASSAKPRSTMKMASAKTTDSTKKTDGNEAFSSTHTHSGRGHSRALSDTTTTTTTTTTPSQAKFSAFNFNHLSSLTASSSQNNNAITHKVPASAVLPSLSSAYKPMTMNTNTNTNTTSSSQNIPFEDVGVIKRWKPPVAEEREKEGKTVKRKSVHDSSPPSHPQTSSSASSSVQMQQPSASVTANGHKPTFEW